MINAAMFSSNTDEWATPQAFFDELNKEFTFTLDPCATPKNAKCARFFTKETDGLAQSWQGNHTAGDLAAQYGKQYEFIVYANKGRAPFNPDMPRYCDIWRIPRITGDKQIHQNQKPTDLLSRIIRQHTKRGDIILDPFGGSLSTAVAAYRLQRDYIVFELDPDEYAAGMQWLGSVQSQVSIFDLI